MEDKRKNYCDIICNFYNNYNGYMNAQEISNLLFCIYGESFKNSVLIEHKEECKKINYDIESDNYKEFYKDIKNLYKNIKEEQHEQ